MVNVFDRHFCQQAWNEIPKRLLPETAQKEWMDQRLHEQWQTGLARRLVDLAQVVQPRLNIVEGDCTGGHGLQSRTQSGARADRG